MLNRLGNVKNRYQGNYKKVLCVCSAGLLRSPTAAWVLSQEPYNFNTRAVGLETNFALIPIDKVLVKWADEIVCMEDEQMHEIVRKFDPRIPVISLNIPDGYEYRNPDLIRLIHERYPNSFKPKIEGV